MYQFDNNSPIWLQIVNDIKIKIVQGHYPSGTQIESVRELASIYAVNPNTIVKSMAELENQHLVETKRGLGKYVCIDDQEILNLRKSIAYQTIKDCLDKCDQLKVDQDLFNSLVTQIRSEGETHE